MSNGDNQFRKRFTAFEQKDKYSSPWPAKIRLRVALWQVVWTLLFRPTPKQMKTWRIRLLRTFGASVTGEPFVSSSARIRMPWNLVLEDHSCIGENATIYNLTTVTLKARCTVAQEVYVCTGAHDLTNPHAPLIVAPIVVGEDAFVGVRALLLPGVRIGCAAVVGGGAVVTRDVDNSAIVVGNPARQIGIRQFGESSA